MCCLTFCAIELRSFDVVSSRRMPDVPIQSLDCHSQAVGAAMADAANHGFGHATAQETFKNDPISRCEQIRLRKESSETR